MSDDLCAICYDEHNETSVILKCNHKYHLDCITQSIKISKCKECPYCRDKIYGSIIRLKKKQDREKELLKPKCCFILKSGINKGNICNKTVEKDTDKYCKRHKKSIFMNIEKENKKKLQEQIKKSIQNNSNTGSGIYKPGIENEIKCITPIILDGVYSGLNKKNKKITIYTKTITEKCKCIIKSGKNKGNLCNRKVTKNGYCGYHQNYTKKNKMTDISPAELIIV
jgi:hypothetical protein